LNLDLTAIDLDAVDAFAARAHAGQTRNADDGSAPEVPYIVHPRAVAAILCGHPDPRARAPWVVATALLHDVLEDCDVHHDEVAALCGESVSAAVRALSKQLRATPNAAKTDAQYWAVMAQAPLQVRMVKAADRLDNLRSCLLWRRDHTATKYLRETPRELLPAIADDPYLYAALCRALAEVAALYARPAG